MKKKMLIVLVVALLIVIGLYVFWLNKNKNDTNQNNTTTINNTTVTEEVVTGTNSCANLLSGAVEPLKDLQTFIDTNYTTVTMTSRSAWDKSKLPKKVMDLEAKNYTCYPLPESFDNTKQPIGMNVQPAVTAVRWDCELKYQDSKYLKIDNITAKQTAEKFGFNCKKISCLSDNTEDSFVWLCYKDSSVTYTNLNPTPSEVVESYLKYTLGSIKGASIDYEKAKELMTPTFAAKFTTPMFIPATYCIQDGPTDVKIKPAVNDSVNNWSTVTVQGSYSSTWSDMWQFTVVSVEGDDWLINKITCLNK